MRCCRVVMPAPSAIWAGCMLARRRVSRGSPVFISSSVMVARLREGWVEQKERSGGQDCPRTPHWPGVERSSGLAGAKGLPCRCLLYCCLACWPQEEAGADLPHILRPTHGDLTPDPSLQASPWKLMVTLHSRPEGTVDTLGQWVVLGWQAKGGGGEPAWGPSSPWTPGGSRSSSVGGTPGCAAATPRCGSSRPAARAHPGKCPCRSCSFLGGAGREGDGSGWGRKARKSEGSSSGSPPGPGILPTFVSTTPVPLSCALQA